MYKLGRKYFVVSHVLLVSTQHEVPQIKLRWCQVLLQTKKFWENYDKIVIFLSWKKNFYLLRNWDQLIKYSFSRKEE